MDDKAPLELDRALRRLAHVSGTQAFDPLLSISWSDLSPDDLSASWEVPPADPIRQLNGYAGLTTEQRVALGRLRLGDLFLTAVEFERGLQRALLAHADGLDPGSAEFDFLYYEISEEARHSQMFGRFSHTVGTSPGALDAIRATMSRASYVDAAGEAPELMFIGALAGEEAIDGLQREILSRHDVAIHPVLRDICNIHVREEARHLSYARLYLRKAVPSLSARRRRRLELVAAPLILETAWLMVAPLPGLLGAFDLNAGAPRKGPVADLFAARTFAVTQRLRELCTELGLWPSWAPADGPSWLASSGRSGPRVWPADRL